MLCPSLDEHPEGFSGCDVAADPNMSRVFLQRMSQSIHQTPMRKWSGVNLWEPFCKTGAEGRHRAEVDLCIIGRTTSCLGALGTSWSLFCKSWLWVAVLAALAHMHHKK